MKKIFCVLILFMTMFIHVSAQESLDKYRIPVFNTIEEYQNLVGKQFTYVPEEGSYGLYSWCGFGREPIEVTIKSIKGKTWKFQTFQKMEWVVTTSTGEEKQMTIYLGTPKMSVRRYKDWYKISDVRFFDMKKWKEDNYDKIGMVYTNPKAKCKYIVTDIKYGKNSKNSYHEKMVPIYVVKNSITNETKEVEAQSAQSQCFDEDLKGQYIATLSKVEKPNNPNLRYGKTSTIEDKEKGETKYGYTDSQIDIFIYVSSTQFNFELKNVSETTQKLVWNEAVFVDTDGSSSKVMHVGTKYSEREGDQPSSTIIRGAKLDDIACPTKNVRYSDVIHEWMTDNILPTKYIKEELPNIRLMLPIQIKDVINEYIFDFNVKWIYEHPELVNI